MDLGVGWLHTMVGWRWMAAEVGWWRDGLVWWVIGISGMGGVGVGWQRWLGAVLMGCWVQWLRLFEMGFL